MKREEYGRVCPFCSDNEIEMLCDHKGESFFVHCVNCGACGPDHPNREDALINWNNRIAPMTTLKNSIAEDK